MQVADFLNADVDLWACMLASFLLGRSPNLSNPRSNSKSSTAATPPRLLSSLPECLIPTVLSFARHRSISDRLSWLPSHCLGAERALSTDSSQHPGHTSIHKLMCSVMHASLKPHPPHTAGHSSRHSLGIAVTNAELATHEHILAAVPQLAWLQVHCSTPSPQAAAPCARSGCLFPSLHSATIIATSTADPRDPGDVAAAVVEALSCIAAAPALHHVRMEQRRVALKPSRSGMALLAARLAALPNLRTLELPSCGIGPHATRALASALACMPALTLLSLDHNPLDGYPTTAGRPELRSSPTDRCCHFGDGFEGLLRIAPRPLHPTAAATSPSPRSCTFGSEWPRLRHLSLLGVNFRPRGSHAFSQLISLLPTLEHVGFSEFGLQTRAVLELATLTGLSSLAVSNSSPRLCGIVTCLRRLRHFRPHGFLGTHGLCAALRSLPDLLTLDLSGHHLPSGGVEDLSPGLRSLRNLQTLTLGHSYLGENGARTLVRLLPCLSRLQQLVLALATVPAAVAVATGAALAALLDLRELRFGWDFLNPKGAGGPSTCSTGMQQFMDAMSGGERLSTLELCCAGLSTARTAAAVAARIAALRALRAVELHRWVCCDPSVVAPFAAELAAWPGVTQLNISRCTLGEDCLATLLWHLPGVTTLRVLRLPRAQMSTSVARALAAALGALRALRVLDGLRIELLDAAAVGVLSAAVARAPLVDVPTAVQVSLRQREVIAEHGPALLRLLCAPENARGQNATCTASDSSG